MNNINPPAMPAPQTAKKTAPKRKYIAPPDAIYLSSGTTWEDTAWDVDMSTQNSSDHRIVPWINVD